MTENEVVEWIRAHRNRLRTPVYVYDVSALKRARDRLLSLLPARARLLYSVKANPQPAIVRHFADLGVLPEIASLGERNMCDAAGVPAAHIVFGGVSKSGEAMRRACQEGCHAVVVDSVSEWDRLLMVIRSGAQSPRILLRIAPGVSLGGLDMAGASQFGMSAEDALSIARSCEAEKASFVGLHFYFGSQRLRPEPIVETVRIAAEHLEAFRAAGLPVKVVDIGLGCGVPYLEKDQPLDYEALRERLTGIWSQPTWHGVEVWSEAGRALVAEAGYFAATVTDVKRLHGKTFAFLDGGINAHNPGIGLGRLFRSNPRFCFVTTADADARSNIDVVGNLCTSADRLGQDVLAPKLSPGDLAVIPHSGAYTHTTGMWGFNSQRGFSEVLIAPGGELIDARPQFDHWTQTHDQ